MHAMKPCCVSFFNATPPTEIYPLSLHDALPIYHVRDGGRDLRDRRRDPMAARRSRGHRRRGRDRRARSEEHTSELQSLRHLVCRLLLEKKKKQRIRRRTGTTPVVRDAL